MAKMTRGRLVALIFIWVPIVVIMSFVLRFWVFPKKEAAEQAVQNQLLTQTSAQSRFDHDISFAYDTPYSGYAGLLSPRMKHHTTGKRIKLSFEDDGAQYVERLKSLRDGRVKMGVFTIGALIKACATLGGDLPVSIIMIIDETRGADAAVAYKDAIPNVDAMNSAHVKFYLTPDSPSETLARVVVSRFKMTNLSSTPFEMLKGPEEVYKKFQQATIGDTAVFFTWEPDVSKMLDNPNAHVVIDSGRFRGYIVDVIVVERKFLAANREVIQKIVEAYLRTMFEYRDSLTDLVTEYGIAVQKPIKKPERLINGIWWKKTSENYAHFGLKPSNYQHIEDMISNITHVLLSTGAINEDPTGGKPNLLYDTRILESMMEDGFRPGFMEEGMRNDTVVLKALSDNEWQGLVPVGKMNVPKLYFARGTAKLSSQSHNALDKLIKTLESAPSYYMLIKGNASKRGNLEANKKLAFARAEAAMQHLISKGVNKDRLRAMGGTPSGEISVDFVFGQTY